MHASALLGLSLAALVACKPRGESGATPTATGASPATTASPATGAPSATGAGTTSANAIATAAPPPPMVPCKAVRKQRLVGLGTQAGEFGALAARAGSVYLVAFSIPAATATLKRFGRDGEGARVVGHSKGPGRVGPNLVLDDDAAYFVHGKSLVKIPLAGGPSTTLREGVIRPITLAEESLWFVQCNSKEKQDELMSLPRAGGEATSRASWPRTTPGKGCQYGDLAITPEDFYMDDWTSRRVLAVSRKDGALRELASKKPFVGRIAVEPADLVFQAQGGLFRVPKAGGEAKNISDWGATPFHFFAWDGAEFFVFNGEAYGMRHSLVQIPLSGGRGKEIEFFQVKDVVMGSGVGDLAVDDSCVYLARSTESYVEVLARPKPERMR